MVVVLGRSSSHYTRVVRMLAHELDVPYALDPIHDLLSEDPATFGGNPALKLPAVRVGDTLWCSGVIGTRLGNALLFDIKVNADRPGRAVVYAVDEGILQVARYQTPDPLGFFFQKRALEVGTSQILDLILPEFSRLLSGAAPGGDTEGALANHLNYVGVLCVEYFLVDTADGVDLIVNEMAPRPHNSGHYTQNACDVSQFEQQVRAMAGLPLRAVRQHSPAIMLNILGDLWFPEGADKTARSPAWDRVLALPGTHLHLYGKLDARPGRKMGHLNITGATVAEVKATAAEAAAMLGLPALS